MAPLGATTGTPMEIAKVLQSEGFDVKVVNARKKKSDTHRLMSLLLLVAACR